MERDLQKLERLRQYAAELQNLIVEAEAGVPDRIEAADRTGTIRMTVGRDSLPETISVAGDWRRELDPGDVAAAVFGAYVACMERRSAAWTRVMERQEFADRLRDLNEREAEMDSPSHPPPPDAPPPSTFPPDAGHIKARPSELIAEDALSAGQMALVLCDTRDDQLREQHYLKSLLSLGVDGIIVTGRRVEPREPIDVPVPVVYAFSPSSDPVR